MSEDGGGEGAQNGTHGARPTADAAPKAPPLNQAERYGGRYSPGGPRKPGAPPPRAPLTPVLIAGGAMLATTMLIMLLGGPGWLGALAGISVFLGGVLYARSRAEKPGRRVVRHTPGADHERAESAILAAEARLAAIDMAVEPLSDEVRAAAAEMIGASRRVLDQLAEDPGDLSRARRFLATALPSAEAAARKFAALGVRDGDLDTRFAALLRDVAAAAAKQAESLRADDVFDLEVEMEVLADRLKSGG